MRDGGGGGRKMLIHQAGTLTTRDCLTQYKSIGICQRG